VITCKVRYFKPLFAIIVTIMAYRYENLYSNFEFGVQDIIITIITNKGLKYLTLHVMSLYISFTF